MVVRTRIYDPKEGKYINFERDPNLPVRNSAPPSTNMPRAQKEPSLVKRLDSLRTRATTGATAAAGRITSVKSSAMTNKEIWLLKKNMQNIL